MPRNAPKVFIDTNVWFSAIYGSPNAEHLVLAHIDKKIQAYTSYEVIKELIQNFEKKLPRGTSVLAELIDKREPVIINTPPAVSEIVATSVHRKDQIIFQAAVNAKVEYFVTGNLKDFEAVSLKKKCGIVVCSPAQLVRTLHLD